MPFSRASEWGTLLHFGAFGMDNLHRFFCTKARTTNLRHQPATQKAAHITAAALHAY